jgi:hypothetical protein
MTDIERELDRLFSVTRDATLPDAGARERVRAGLSARLSAAEAPSAPERLSSSRGFRLGLGAAVVGIAGFVLLLSTRQAFPERVVAPAPSSQVASSLGPRAEPAPLPESAPSPPAAISALTPSRPAPAAVVVAESPSPAARVLRQPDDEVALVRAMQQALRSGNAEQALALGGEHARRFPGGTLVQEREGARAIARCQLATPDARSAIYDDFGKRFGASPYAARVKAACQ